MSDQVLRLSWSRLRLHAECPAKGDLMRKASSPYKDARNFFHGNVTDLLLRRWLASGVQGEDGLYRAGPDGPAPGWMAAHVDEVFEESLAISRDSGDGIVKWKTKTDRAETLEFCRELVIRLEVIVTREVLPNAWLPAFRFAAPIKVPYLDGELREILLVGEMDLPVLMPSGLWRVWDLKATKNDAYYEKVLGQLAFYAIVQKILKGAWPEYCGLIQPMCTEQVLKVHVDEDARRQMAGRIIKTTQDIWAGRLAPKAGDEGCGWCDVHNACPKFKVRPGRGGFRAKLPAA